MHAAVSRRSTPAAHAYASIKARSSCCRLLGPTGHTCARRKMSAEDEVTGAQSSMGGSLGYIAPASANIGSHAWPRSIEVRGLPIQFPRRVYRGQGKNVWAGIVGVGVLILPCSKRIRPWSTNRHVNVHAHAHGWLVLPRDPGRSWVAAGPAGPPCSGVKADVSKLASGSTWWGTEAARGRPGRTRRPIDEVFGGFCRSLLVALVPYLIRFIILLVLQSSSRQGACPGQFRRTCSHVRVQGYYLHCSLRDVHVRVRAGSRLRVNVPGTCVLARRRPADHVR